MQLCMNECPEAMLGGLETPVFDPSKPFHNGFSGTSVVNGVELPDRVLHELQRLGIALSWYSSSQLEDAVLACRHDGTLVDDPDGVSFLDMITLTDDERKAAAGHGKPEAPHRRSMRHVKESEHVHGGFCDRLKCEREASVGWHGEIE